MSIVTLSALLDQISGRIGTVVFCRDGVGGPYCRGFGPVLNPQTSYQLEVRAMLSAIAKAWSTLTESQRNSWNHFAKAHKWKNRLAQDTTITGIDWFSKLNFQKNYYCETGTAFALIEDAPSGIAVRPLTKMSVTSAVAATGVITLSVTPAPAAAVGTFLIFFTSNIIRPGVTKAPRINFQTAVPNSEDAITDYNFQPGRYTEPTVGARAAIGVARINSTNGMMTQMIEATMTFT